MADKKDKIEETEKVSSQKDAKVEVASEAEATGKKKVVPRKSKRGKAIKQISQGRIYIQATYNNTMVTATDLNGNVIAWSSAGHMGFKGPRKSTPFAAGNVIRDLADKIKPVGLNEVSVFVKGVGSGREAAIRALNANGISVSSIKDITPLPHNGCRKPRPRRV